MTKTFNVLLKHMEETKPHAYVEGRSSAYSIPDMIDKGQDMMQAQAARGVEDIEMSENNGSNDLLDGGVDNNIDAEDISVDSVL